MDGWGWGAGGIDWAGYVSILSQALKELESVSREMGGKKERGGGRKMPLQA